jgi:hypothetical protein
MVPYRWSPTDGPPDLEESPGFNRGTPAAEQLPLPLRGAA